MAGYPILVTPRLVLRQFVIEEAMVVRKLAGAYEIAHGCLNIPHPYGAGMAETWISCHDEWYREGSQIIFAITRAEDGWLLGAVGLVLDEDHARGELGYWIGVPFQGCGYATEAARAVLLYAFETLSLNRITASYFVRNPASGHVLEKVGIHREGLLRRHLKKEGVFEDVIICGILRDEWSDRQTRPSYPVETA
ncbi:MAG TPA: GNAT family N-acetyltransferase [Methanospirillum sp.]|nr:GNAT family N-acetyltransferase [Methanospirillum sp.]